MEGAALIMLRYSSPVQQCSTALGRSLFEWYCGFEDLFCVLAAYESRLPPEWRDQDFRIRALIAEVEYKLLPQGEPEKRIPRMLDDVWGHMYAIGPQLRKVVAGGMELKTLEKGRVRQRARELDALAREVDSRMTGFMKSPLVEEVLTTVPFQQEYYFNLHEQCCPYFPLEPILFRFPPAGVFLIAALCLQAYLRLILHPSILAELDPTRGDTVAPMEGKSAEEMALIICRTFAGLESTLVAEFPEIIIPCQASMMIAGMACPPYLRLWVFCKLLHLDRVGQPLSDVVRRNLAQQWNMPELETLYTHQVIPRSRLERRAAAAEITELAEVLDKVELAEEGESSSGDDMEDKNLTEQRGIFLMGKDPERGSSEPGGVTSEQGGSSISGENIRRPVFSF